MSRAPRWLVVGAAGPRYAIDASLPAHVERVERIERVPLAPLEIVGVAEAAGRVVTLLDPLPETADPGTSPSGLAVLLASPFEHLALFVRGGERLEPPEPGSSRREREDLLTVSGEFLDRLVGRLVGERTGSGGLG